jgi:hypothetical protein
MRNLGPWRERHVPLGTFMAVKRRRNEQNGGQMEGLGDETTGYRR